MVRRHTDTRCQMDYLVLDIGAPVLPTKLRHLPAKERPASLSTNGRTPDDDDDGLQFLCGARSPFEGYFWSSIQTTRRLEVVEVVGLVWMKS